MQQIRTFGRFKYAEEFVHYDLEAHGCRTWVFYRGPDEVLEEYGETYVNPVYVVEWNDGDDDSVST